MTDVIFRISTNGPPVPLGRIKGYRFEFLFADPNTVTWEHFVYFRVTENVGETLGTTVHSSVNCHTLCDYTNDGRITRLVPSSGAVSFGYDVTSRTMRPRRAPSDTNLITTTTVTSTLDFQTPNVNSTGDMLKLAESPSYRCDNTSTDFRVTNGCVYSNYTPTLTYRLAAASVPQLNVREVAQHIQAAQAAGLPGAVASGTPLKRETRRAVIDANRRQAQALCSRLVRPTGAQCDEYPFATSVNRGPRVPVSVKFVDGEQNRNAGTQLRQLNLDFRMLQGDPYWVAIVP